MKNRYEKMNPSTNLISLKTCFLVSSCFDSCGQKWDKAAQIPSRKKKKKKKSWQCLQVRGWIHTQKILREF